MKGGYYMLDGSGINLFVAEGPAPTIAGMYSKVEKAYKSGKPVMLYNIKGDNGETPATLFGPIPCFIEKFIDNVNNKIVYIIKFGIYDINVEEDDSVVVDNPINALIEDINSLDERVTALEQGNTEGNTEG